MEARVKRINRALKRFDPDLFSQRDDNGQITIYKKGITFDRFDYQGSTLFYSRSSPKYVCSLTSNWTTKGEPREWGIERIISRLQSMDRWNNSSLDDALIQQYLDMEIQKTKDLRNNTESFLWDQKSNIRRAFADINVANMDKKLDKRRLKDGYCK